MAFAIAKSTEKTNGYGNDCDNVIPETPEKMLVANHLTSPSTFKASEDENESPIIKPKTKVKRLLMSDSDSDGASKKKKRQWNNKEYDSYGRHIDRVKEAYLTNKELGLKVLKEKFPKRDLMMLQDTLVSCDWQHSKACHVLESNCDAATCTHFPAKSPSPVQEESENSDLEPEPVKQPPPQLSFKTVEKTLKTLDGWFSKTKMSAISRQVNSRRRIHSLSSSDDEGVNKTNNVLNGGKVQSSSAAANSIPLTRKAHELSDNDDDDDVINAPLREREDGGGEESTLQMTKKKISTENERRSKKSKKSKKKKKRRDVQGDSDEYDDDYGKDDVYDSDDSDLDETETPARLSVIKFFNESTNNEILTVAGISKKKMDSIVALRPFNGWGDLVKKIQSDKLLSTDILNGAREVIHMREVMNKLMVNCEKCSKEMEKLYTNMKLSENNALIKEQPSKLNKDLKLAPYQMVGLNWLYLMHLKDLNGILADEMGLGKTIQAIAFLSHLLEKGEPGPHLIIAPSSVLDNWIREINTWCSDFEVISYRGSQAERRELRIKLVNNEVPFNILITTYNMVGSSPEDRALFKRLQFHYVIFDEAHMLKNMASIRYKNLMGVKAHRRLCLTGTPLQNNLVELMSLLIFVMPGMFHGKIDEVRKMFAATGKTEENRGNYERDRIEQAKQIMKPFVLRRLKSEVLTQLPAKNDQVKYIPMSSNQKKLYEELVNNLKNVDILNSATAEVTSEDTAAGKTGGIGMVMELRKAANHPLLRRCIYTDAKLKKIAAKLKKERKYADSNEQYVFEDLQVMSDFEIHKLCSAHKLTKEYALKDENILDSGKFQALDNILAEWGEKGERILIFSQFVIMLNIIEEYMKIKQHKYVRLDGSTPVGERQDLIDNFTDDKDVFVFLLSTKAGGLGINLTAANVVVLHDIDYNPYNDKQAEDRCHRVGQTREVTVIRMISQGTIEEGMLHCAQEKLRLEKNITSNENADESKSLASNLLKSALGYSQAY